MRLGVVGIIAVAIPALEIVGIYQIGHHIGVLWTLIWLMSAMFIGGAVIRQEQAMFLPRLQQAMAQGQAPFGLIWASGRRFLAGLLLILPGAASDLIAILLLLWPSSRVSPGSSQKPIDPVDPFETRTNPPGYSAPRPDSRRSEGEVIEGEFKRED